MYYILTTFLEPCSSTYVNIKGGGTIPTLLNQVEWKLLCLASDVIPLYTRSPIAVMCRRNRIWHCQHGGKCFQSGPKSHLNLVSSAVIFYILLKHCCVSKQKKDIWVVRKMVRSTTQLYKKVTVYCNKKCVGFKWFKEEMWMSKVINNSVIKHPNEGKVTLHNSKYGLYKVIQHESKPVTFILTKNMNKKVALFK